VGERTLGHKKRWAAIRKGLLLGVGKDLGERNLLEIIQSGMGRKKKPAREKVTTGRKDSPAIMLGKIDSRISKRNVKRIRNALILTKEAPQTAPAGGKGTREKHTAQSQRGLKSGEDLLCTKEKGSWGGRQAFHNEGGFNRANHK